MEGLQFCSIGFSEADCHKTTYTETCLVKTGLKRVEELESNILDLLKRRIGSDINVNSTDTLCLHHEKILLDKYSHLHTSCCDPYHRHKRRMKKI